LFSDNFVVGTQVLWRGLPLSNQCLLYSQPNNIFQWRPVSSKTSLSRSEMSPKSLHHSTSRPYLRKLLVELSARKWKHNGNLTRYCHEGFRQENTMERLRERLLTWTSSKLYFKKDKTPNLTGER
jgi:hypothetical protein